MTTLAQQQTHKTYITVGLLGLGMGNYEQDVFINPLGFFDFSKALQQQRAHDSWQYIKRH